MNTRWTMALVLTMIVAGCATALAATAAPELQGFSDTQRPVVHLTSYDCPVGACSVVYKSESSGRPSTVIDITQ